METISFRETFCEEAPVVPHLISMEDRLGEGSLHNVQKNYYEKVKATVTKEKKKYIYINIYIFQL